MYIYFDESGIFANPAGKEHAVSCVTGLAIPETRKDVIFRKYKEVVSHHAKNSGEVKGSDLEEKEIYEIINLLVENHALAEIFAIDIGLHENDKIEKHKKRQAEGLVANLTDEHADSLKEQVYDLKSRLEKLPNQLYVQSVLTTKAVSEVLQTSTLYYGLRMPSELSSFHWTFDAKGTDMTPYEEIWKTIVLPLVESRSIDEPFISSAEEVDYSHFKRFEKSSESVPDHLKGHVDVEGVNFST
jgi:hypothetical protein